MANIFQKIAVPKTHFSNFNLTHEFKAGMDMGYLVPVMCVEALPNDTFQGSTEAFIRLAPLTFPLMQRVNAKTYTFFVPNRILWKYWPEFIAEDEEDVAPSMLTADLADVVNAYFANTLQNRYLVDYLGFPPEVLSEGFKGNMLVSLLPLLAYQKIWNDYFRDENLQSDLFQKDKGTLYLLGQEQGSITNTTWLNDLVCLRKKAWEKDYFTSALPEPQLGDPVPVPVSGTVSVDAGARIQFNRGNSLLQLMDPLVSRASGIPQSVNDLGVDFRNGVNPGNLVIAGDAATFDDVKYIQGSLQGSAGITKIGGLTVDNAAFTINDLRLASAIQRFNELLARAGHRYKETILSMFNQVTPDYRLDRPEFICSQNIGLQVSDIAQTSETTPNGTPQATLAGKGTVYGNGGMFRYHCEEHGFLITLMTVIPRTSYVNGISRMWTRQDRYDYYTPVFENLGEQSILNKEVFVSGSADDDETFGYAPRYSEYKYIPSSVHTDFRSSLDFMTLTRMFDSLPSLNGDFITPDDETLNRGFAVQEGSEQHLYVDVVNHLLARRPMQKLPIPKLV